MSRPPTAGPSAAPVAPATAQTSRRPALGADGRGQQLERRADRRRAAGRLHAAGGDQRPEVLGRGAGEAGAGEQDQPGDRGPRRADSPGRDARPEPRAAARTRLKATRTQTTPLTLDVDRAVDLGQGEDDDRGVGEHEPDGERQRSSSAMPQ